MTLGLTTGASMEGVLRRGAGGLGVNGAVQSIGELGGGLEWPVWCPRPSQGVWVDGGRYAPAPRWEGRGRGAERQGSCPHPTWRAGTWLLKTMGPSCTVPSVLPRQRQME